ncbi:MAG: serine/threonine-protein phosphatase [Leptospiraceae bacterium]|nr:serine/threonine-protein phosphatase [Leptospiraceae bacterium]MCP5512018.1 serine/threonine-protein phosphatase [Leptospiraceae bacterium]
MQGEDIEYYKYWKEELKKQNDSGFPYFISLSSFGIMLFSLYDYFALNEHWISFFFMRLFSVFVGFFMLFLHSRKKIQAEFAAVVFLIVSFTFFSYGAIFQKTENLILAWNINIAMASFIWPVIVMNFSRILIIFTNFFFLIQYTILIKVLSPIPIDRFFIFGGGFILFAVIIGPILGNIRERINSKTIRIQFERERLISSLKSDLSLAKRIQNKLIPSGTLNFSGLEVISQYLPLEDVGGDIFDITKLENGKIRIMLADATGHGVQAALITMLIKSEYESVKTASKSPQMVIDILNYMFYNKYYHLDCIFSFFIADINLDYNEFVYASAGHPDQVFIQNGQVKVLPKTGRILGMMENSKFNESVFKFNPGDKILLFTDGLYEEFNNENEEYGDRRVINIIEKQASKSVSSIMNTLISQLNEFVGKEQIQDDITVIGIEYSEEIKAQTI